MRVRKTRKEGNDKIWGVRVVESGRRGLKRLGRRAAPGESGQNVLGVRGRQGGGDVRWR